MDANKNSYTFMFAAVMVVIVAALLSYAATTLKPFQDKNVELEKMQNILSSIAIETSREGAAELYPTYITSQLVIRDNTLVEGEDAFNLDMAKEIRKSISERNSPLFIAEKEGSTYYIVPLRGVGLWGPIWGYIALEKDLSTIYGANFDHKAETPGLGAEINTPSFYDQFKGKSILDESGNLIGIYVIKGGASGPNEVDGISGGTITSDGVQLMITENLKAYIPFLKEYVGYQSVSAYQPSN